MPHGDMLDARQTWTTLHAVGIMVSEILARAKPACLVYSVGWVGGDA